jgi:malonyl-CoA O-methyltransferase
MSEETARALPPTIDPVAAARWARRPMAQSPWLHEEVGRRMEDRLQWIKLQPRRWLHWQPLQGGLKIHQALSERYPQADCTLVEPDARREAVVRQALRKPWWRPSSWGPAWGRTPRWEQAESLSMDMVWANMALHMAADPQALIAEWHRVLAVDGFLMFSCLGPDTARELRTVYAELGWPPPAHSLTDMHDWGDMLVHAGFAEPVMDMERVTLTYDTPQRLLAELREIGCNLHPARFAGLRGRAWHDRLEAALKSRLARPDQDGRLALTVEMVFGHAIKPRPRLKVAAETTLSLDEMRSTLLESKKKSPGA